MKVLIVGGKGQLGTTLTKSIHAEVNCVSLDLPEFDITDTRQSASVVEKEQPDVIVNASGYTAVDRAEEEVELAFAVNATGPENLALAAKQTGSRLIHVSTDYVFDGTSCTPYKPDTPCNPLGVYGTSKRQGETKIQSVLDDAVIIRTSWLYSQFGSNFVLTMLRLMKERDELKVVSDQIGAPTWTGTLAKAIWAAIDNPEISSIFHWSDAGVASWYDFAVAIQEEAFSLGILNRQIPIRPISNEQFPAPVKRPPYSVLDCTASWQELNIDPIHWRLALKRMLDIRRVVC